MANETVLIGCRLANGLILTHPQKKFLQVKINGTYDVMPGTKLYFPPKPYATTEVSGEFWESWSTAYKTFPPLVNHAIFVARDAKEASAKAREVESVKTGLEPMKQDAVIDGVRMQKATE